MTILKFDPRQFFIALSQVKLACSKDDAFPALTLISARAEGNSLHLAATDRYRVHYAHVDLYDAVEPVAFALPGNAVTDLKSMGWNAKRGGPVDGTATVVGSEGVTFSALDSPEIRYPRPEAEDGALDAAHGVLGLLSTAINRAGQENADRPSVMAYNPAFISDIQRAARLAPTTHVIATTENVGRQLVCSLSDESTRFRALVMGVNRPDFEPVKAHAAVVEGLDRLSELGRPSSGYVIPAPFRKDGSTERAASDQSTGAPEPANA